KSFFVGGYAFRLRRHRNELAHEDGRAGWLPGRRPARGLDRYGIGCARDHRGIVGRQVGPARLVPDYAERARTELGVYEPEFIRLAGRRLRQNRTNGQLPVVEIDRHLEGWRGRVLLQDRHIFAWGRLPSRLARGKTHR